MNPYRIIIIGILMLTSSESHAQTIDYLGKAKEFLAQGDCERARYAYEDYKKTHPSGDADVERRIAECGKPSRFSRRQYHDTTFTIKGVGFKMVFVEGGTFIMGCTFEKENCYDGVLPAHDVTVNDFWICETEVTVELFQTFIKETGYLTDAEKKGGAWGMKPKDGERGLGIIDGLYWIHDEIGIVRSSSEKSYPVLYVSWNDAKDFCEWLKQKTGFNFRLPTEAEWEYVARGGKKSKNNKYPGGDTIGDVAWYRTNCYDKSNLWQEYGPHPVKGLQPNELGLYDLAGNVSEWCSDWYGSYNDSFQTNPKGPSFGLYRVVRGGHWLVNASECRVYSRGGMEPETSTCFCGFRFALDCR